MERNEDVRTRDQIGQEGDAAGGAPQDAPRAATRGLSRRSFVEVAVGTLATLPFATVGSYVLAPAGSALAEEADESEVDGGDAKGPSLKIIAAKPYETSFIVADMADGAQTAVKGAKVKVTRQDGKGSAEGVTDDKGIAIIDIAKIANNPNGNKDVYKMSSYVLAGSISVTASGYRDFEVGLTYVEGGQLIEVPTRKLSENLPYPACATIAGWDMLYTKNDFLLDSANTANVDAKVVVKNLGAGECTLSLTHGKTGEAFAQAKVTPTGGVATATFTQELLKRDSAKAFAEKDNYLRIEQGGKSFVTALSPTFSKPAANKAPNASGVKFSPLSMDGKAISGLGLKWPKSIPVIGGSDVKVWTPDWLINVDYNPFGYLRITIPMKRWGKDYNTDTKKWTDGFSMPRKSISEQFNKLVKTAGDMSAKAGSAISGGAIEKIDTFGSVSFRLNFQLLLGAQWDKGTGALQYSGGLQLFGSMDASYTMNYMLGPIPALIIFGFNATADASGTLGGRLVQKDKTRSFIDDMFDWSLVEWDPMNTGLSFRITPVVSASVGVGIRGVASICVKGSIGLAFYIAWSPAAPKDGKSQLHVILSFIARLDLVLHMFLFTKTFLLADGSKPNWVDNWKNQLGTSAEGDDLETIDPWANYTLEELADSLEFISDDMLETIREDELGIINYDEGIPDTAGDNWEPAEENWWPTEDDPSTYPHEGEDDWEKWYGGDELTGQSDDHPTNLRIGFRRSEDMVAPLEDGTPIHYYTYDFGLLEPEPTPADAQTQAQKDDAEKSKASDAAQAQKQGDAQTATTDQAKDPTADGATDANATGTTDGATATPDADATDSNDQKGDATPGAAAAAGAAAAGAAGTLSPDEGATANATPLSADEAATPDASTSTPAAGTTDAGTTDQTGAADAGTTSKTSDAADDKADAATDADAKGNASDKDKLGAQAQETTQTQGEQPGQEQLDAAAETAAAAGAPFLNTQFAVAADTPVSIKGVGMDGGLRPTSDTKINANVFGDPRSKVITVNIGSESKTYLFRLGTAKVRAFDISKRKAWIVTRTRLTATLLTGGAAGQTHKFDIYVNPRKPRDGFKRWEYYDYDYDLEFLPSSSGGTFSVAIICGKRALGEGETIASLDGVMADTAFLFFKVDARDMTSGATSRISNWFVRTSEQVFGDGSSNKIHSISNLSCHLQGSTMLVNYLDRCVDEGQQRQLVTSDNVETKLGVMFVNFSSSNKRVDPVKIASWNDISAKIGTLPKDLFEMQVSEAVGGEHTIMLRGGKRVTFLIMKVDYATSGGVLQNIVKGKTVYEFDEKDPVGSMPPRLVPWRKHEGFLCSHGGKLQQAKWNSSYDLEFTPVGPTEYGVQAFGISRNGNLIFWPQSRDGDQVSKVDDETGDVTTERQKVFHIMACRIWGANHFSDPFIMADLPHDADQLSVVGVGGSALDLLITELVKGKDSDLEYGANLWRTRIPHVKSVTALRAEAPNARVTPGGSANFDVTLRNDGNTFISGCKVVMYCDNEKVSETQLTFSKDTLRESVYNQSDEKGNPTNVESDWSLAPGKTQTHRVSMPIPAEWRGEKKVGFQAVSPTMVTSGGLYNQDDDDWDEGDVIEYENEPIDIMDEVWTEEDDADWSDLNDAPVEVLGSTASAPRSSSRLPDTADPTTGIVPAALAAAGAAALAYERRRRKYENMVEEDEE